MFNGCWIGPIGLSSLGERQESGFEGVWFQGQAVEGRGLMLRVVL